MSRVLAVLATPDGPEVFTTKKARTDRKRELKAAGVETREIEFDPVTREMILPKDLLEHEVRHGVRFPRPLIRRDLVPAGV